MEQVYVVELALDYGREFVDLIGVVNTLEEAYKLADKGKSHLEDYYVYTIISVMDTGGEEKPTINTWTELSEYVDKLRAVNGDNIEQIQYGLEFGNASDEDCQIGNDNSIVDNDGFFNDDDFDGLF